MTAYVKISISYETKKRLVRYGKMGEKMNDVISRILDHFETDYPILDTITEKKIIDVKRA